MISTGMRGQRQRIVDAVTVACLREGYGGWRRTGREQSRLGGEETWVVGNVRGFGRKMPFKKK